MNREVSKVPSSIQVCPPGTAHPLRRKERVRACVCVSPGGLDGKTLMAELSGVRACGGGGGGQGSFSTAGRQGSPRVSISPLPGLWAGSGPRTLLVAEVLLAAVCLPPIGAGDPCPGEVPLDWWQMQRVDRNKRRPRLGGVWRPAGVALTPPLLPHCRPDKERCTLQADTTLLSAKEEGKFPPLPLSHTPPISL